jgi:hypothetical protein
LSSQVLLAAELALLGEPQGQPFGGQTTRGDTIEPVPDEVLEAAHHAFDTRRPGGVVLDLVQDEQEHECVDHESSSRLLVFRGEALTVEVRLVDSGGQRAVTIDVPGQPHATVSLEQLAPSVRVVKRAVVPARFVTGDGVFLSVLVSVPGQPDRSTAWVHR